MSFDIGIGPNTRKSSSDLVANRNKPARVYEYTSWSCQSASQLGRLPTIVILKPGRQLTQSQL